MSGETPRRGERGAGIVEFALILPLVASLVFGVLTGGIAYNRKISITSAVREGARFGATLACDSTCSPTNATWISQVIQRMIDVSGGELTTNSVCAWLGQTPDSSSNCGVSDPTGAANGTWVVKVSATRSATLQVIFFTQNLTLTSRTVASYERGSTYGQSSA